jgi:hypothetical protein
MSCSLQVNNICAVVGREHRGSLEPLKVYHSCWVQNGIHIKRYSKLARVREVAAMKSESEPSRYSLYHGASTTLLRRAAECKKFPDTTFPDTKLLVA